MMLRVFAVGIIALLTACSSSEPVSPAGTESDEVTYELVGARWALVRLGDKAVTVREGGREPYVVLNSVESSVVGYAGCNRISSTYQLHDAQLSFGDVIATRMFCDDMPTETALLEALKATTGWRISGRELTLLDAAQHPVAVFEARNL